MRILVPSTCRIDEPRCSRSPQDPQSVPLYNSVCTKISGSRYPYCSRCYAPCGTNSICRAMASGWKVYEKAGGDESTGWNSPVYIEERDSGYMLGLASVGKGNKSEKMLRVTAGLSYPSIASSIGYRCEGFKLSP
jgi:hypothetical protein